jgi:hypothetical protein
MKHLVISAAILLFVTATVAAQPTPGQRPPADSAQRRRRQLQRQPVQLRRYAEPADAADTVWMEDMTWMDVRDAVKGGKTTVIVSTGGIEPNGPWLALGKHNFVLQDNCDAIASKLGNALCAPIVPFVPEGSIEPKSSHMLTVGTISSKRRPFEALLTDIARSYRRTASRTSSSSATAAATRTG